MDIGTLLREARVKAGMSRGLIAREANVPLDAVWSLEENGFHRFPRELDLDGTVRIYARLVGLDGDEIVRAIRAPHASPTGEPPATSGDDFSDAFFSESDPTRHQPPPELNRRSAGPPALLPDVPPPPGQTPPAPPAGPALRPELRGRRTALMATAVVVLAAALIGGYSYVDDRYPPDSSPSGPPMSPSTGAGQAATPTDSPRTPEPVDAPRNDSAGAPQGATLDRVSPPATERQAPIGEPAPSTEPSRSPARSAPTTEPSLGKDRPALTADLTGTWTLSTRVERSSLASFEGLRLGYEIDLRQDGGSVTGKGRKVSENDKPLSGRAQTSIDVEGSWDAQGRLLLAFRERGSRRESAGRFVFSAESDELLRGRFSSDAAQSAGTVEARRR